MPNDKKKKAMIRTRNCLMKSVSVVCVFVCVFESVAIALFYFRLSQPKFHFMYYLILVVTCNNKFYFIHPGYYVQ